MTRDQVQLLYETQGARVFSDARKLMRDEQAAGDIVQGIFKYLLANPDLNPSNPVAYLETAVRNGVLAWRKRMAAERTHRVYDEPVWTAPPELSELHQAVEKALHELSYEHQEVLQMYFWQKLTKPQIAERTSLPLSTVESRVRHALEKLEPILCASIKEHEDELGA